VAASAEDRGSVITAASDAMPMSLPGESRFSRDPGRPNTELRPVSAVSLDPRAAPDRGVTTAIQYPLAHGFIPLVLSALGRRASSSLAS